MHIKTDRTYIGTDGRISLNMVRTGILAGFLIYGIFGALDPFMIPSKFEHVWIIRFGIITPAILICYLLSFARNFHSFAKPLLKTLLFLGELGILGMIYIAEPADGAFLNYYGGLILVILWSGFIFRFTFTESLFYFLSILILYNLIAISRQDILNFPANSAEFGTYIGNNFFLSATGLLSLIGTNNLDKYFKEISSRNKELRLERNELKKAKNKAEESDRLKTAFLTNMSHEIRTPMNGIIGFSGLYLDEDSTAEEKEHYARIVIDSSKQLLRIVNDILDLSKIETNQVSINPKTQNLNKMLDQINLIFTNRFKEKDIELNLSYPDNDYFALHTDHTRLYQIISNLLENAFKFTKSGSIDFGYKINENELEFFVKDTGIGIPQNYQTIIFERFRQLETSQTKEFRGAGLGLSITKHLVSLLGGKIWLRSREEEGTQFYFTIPIKDLESPVEKKTHPSKTKQISESIHKHILITEDEAHNFFLLKTYLKDAPIKVGHATDGQEAIDYVRNNPDLDLILMDVKMPNLNGIEALKVIRKEHQQIPIIAQTAFVMAEDKEKLLEFGFDDYLPKPIEAKALFETLNNFLASNEGSRN